MPRLSQSNKGSPSIVWTVQGRLGGTSDFQMVVDLPSTAGLGTRGLVPTPITQGSFSSADAHTRERVLELRELEIRSSLWRQHLLDKSASTDVDVISETVDSLLDAVTLMGPEGVDLASLDLANANAEHLVAVLRATFVWRGRLPGWAAALQAAPSLLVEAGFDPQLVLKGLDQ